jgi:hypothetical protein
VYGSVDGSMNKSISSWLLAGVLLIITAIVFVHLFNRLPIEEFGFGLDWKGLWFGLKGGLPRYGSGLRNPPWSIVPVLPLGLLSYRSSWGILILMTLVAEIVSVPRKIQKTLRILLTVLLVISYPSIRTMADGNFEVLTIAGVLTLLYALRKQNAWLLSIGILVASVKPQTTWLLFVALPFYLIDKWPRKKIIQASIVTFIIVAIFLLAYGVDWFASMIGNEQRGSIMDISLLAALTRLQLSPIVIGCIWGVIFGLSLYIIYSSRHSIDRTKAGFLMSASLLLSPYAAGNSMLSLFTVGVIPLYIGDRMSAGALSIAFNLPYLFIHENPIWFSYGAYYTTLVLLLSWIVFSWKVRAHSRDTLVKSRQT